MTSPGHHLAIAPFAVVRGRHLLWLLAILAANASFNAIRLSNGPLRTWHESVVIRTAQETWLRMHSGVENAWLFPHFADEVRVGKPPMTVWLVLLTWSDLAPVSVAVDPDQPDLLVARARIVAPLLTLIAIVGVFLSASALAGPATGLIAAGFFGTLPVVLEFSRMATHDIGLVAGTTVAIGCAFYAIDIPGRGPSNGRRIAWWIGFAIALAFAWLTKGPLALVIVAGGVVPALILTERTRLRNAASFLLALIGASALALPWFIALAQSDEQIAARLIDTYGPSEFDARPFWYYLYHVNWMLPWPLVILAGLIMLVMRRADPDQRRRSMAWAWLFLLFLFFSITPQKVMRYLLPVFPPLMIVSAIAWCDLHRLIVRGDRRARGVMTAHWGLLGLASLAVLLGAIFLPQILDRGWIDTWRNDIPSRPMLGVIALALLALVACGQGWSRRGMLRASVPAIAWSAIICGLIIWTRHGPMERTRLAKLHAQAAIIDRIVGPGDLYYRDAGGAYSRSELFIYMNRPVDLPSVREVRAWPPPQKPRFLLTGSESISRRLEWDGFDVVVDAMTFDPPHRILRQPDS